jgi:hypothetical protein
MAVFKLIPLILKWLPHVVTAVSLIEVLASDKPGAEKKRAAMAWLEKTSAKLNLPWGGQAVNVVGNLVDASVGVANLVGAFRPKEEVLKPVETPAPDPDLEQFLAQGFKE